MTLCYLACTGKSESSLALSGPFCFLIGYRSDTSIEAQLLIKDYLDLSLR